MDTLSNPPLEIEEEKYTIDMTLLEVYSSVFNVTEHNNIFTIYTPGYWQDPDTTEELEELIEQRKSNEFELHVNEVNKRRLEIKVGLTSYQLSDLKDLSKRNEFFKALKVMKFNDLDDMVFTMNITYNEIECLIDEKSFAAEVKSFSFPHGINEVRKINNT